MIFYCVLLALCHVFGIHLSSALLEQKVANQMPCNLRISPQLALRGRDHTATFNCTAVSTAYTIDFNSVAVLCGDRPLPASGCQSSYSLSHCSFTCGIKVLESADCFCAVIPAVGRPRPVSHDVAMHIGSEPLAPRLAMCEWNESLVIGSPFLCELRPNLDELERLTGLPLPAAELSLNVSFAHWSTRFQWRQCDMLEAATFNFNSLACTSGELCCVCDAKLTTAKQRCAWNAADSEDFANETLLVRTSVCNRIGWCGSKTLMLHRSDYKRPLPLSLNVSFELSPRGNSILALVLPLPQLRHLTTVFETEATVQLSQRVIIRNSTLLESAQIRLVVPPLTSLKFCVRRRAVNRQHWSYTTCLTLRSPPAHQLCPPAQSFVDADGRQLWIGQSHPDCSSSPAEAAAAAEAAEDPNCQPQLPNSGGLVQCRCDSATGILFPFPAPAACQAQNGSDLALRRLPQPWWWRGLRLQQGFSSENASVAGSGLPTSAGVTQLQAVLLICATLGGSRSSPLLPEGQPWDCQPGQLLLLLRANSLLLSGPLLQLRCSSAANASSADAFAKGCWHADNWLLCLAATDCRLHEGGYFECPRLEALAGALGCQLNPPMRPHDKFGLSAQLLLLLPLLLLAIALLVVAAFNFRNRCCHRFLAYPRRRSQVPPAKDYGIEPGSERFNCIGPKHSALTEFTSATGDWRSETACVQRCGSQKMEIPNGYFPWSEQDGFNT